jgi:predicted protein tyrosine phosphatase
MWIENVSLANIVAGYHFDPGPNSMLIQIVDPDMEFPTPKIQFKEVYQFKFLDLEESDQYGTDHKITDNDAEQIARALQRATDGCMNVVVHCHAGVCRSGAVAEVGVMMGFLDTGAFRAPNLMVKHKLLKALGMVYNKE